jgi:glycosyltransferase involved in cell wall biosynthesis
MISYLKLLAGVSLSQGMSDRLPSLPEGMPISMIEAMAVGTVVIVTDTGSIKTVITNNVNGNAYS